MKLIKTFAIFCLGALLIGCTPSYEGNSPTKGLWLSLDKADIYDNDGATEDGIARFTLTKDGVVVPTEDYALMTTPDYNEIYGGVYTSSEKGTVKFIAQYGTLVSNEVSLTVIATPPPAPAAPVDNDPSNLNFNRRVLLAQFTGTGCQNCPFMVNAFYDITHNEEYLGKNYDKKIAIAAAHSGDYATTDNAAMTKDLTFDDYCGVTYWPYLVVDFKRNVSNITPFAEYISYMVDTALARVNVRGGIAVNSEYHAEQNYVVLTALVKAKVSTEFRIGAMLLEDDIYSPQSISTEVTKNPNINYDYHENCIRRIMGKQSNYDFSGATLGYIEAGSTKTKEFAFPLSKTWVPEKLRLLVYISTKEADGNWYVNNVVKASINGETDFEYAE